MALLQEVRPDFHRIRAAKGETRSAERLITHFMIERQLAKQLAASTKQERSTLYFTVYQKLFAAIDDHPQHRGSTKFRQARIEAQVAFLRRLLGPSSIYVEVGCGDAMLTKAIAPFVTSSIGVDVTAELVDFRGAAPSFSFSKTNGVRFELPTCSTDLVYSKQLMEHLHTEDAVDQLENIYRILKPGRHYICTTPNRLTGPHDISCHFGYEPAGLHMQEYDHRSLSRLF